MNVSGVLINRVHPQPDHDQLLPEDIERLQAISNIQIDGRSFAQRVQRMLQDASLLGAADARALGLLDELDAPRKLIPHFNRDLHSMDDLKAFAQQFR